MRAWRTRQGELLVEGAAGSLSHGAEELNVQPAVFYLLAPEGVKRFAEPQGYTVEDEIGMTNIHVIRGTELVRYFWRQRGPYPPEVDVEVELQGLTPAPDVPAEARQAIQALEAARGREAAVWSARLTAWRDQLEAAVEHVVRRMQQLGATTATWRYGSSHSEWVVSAPDGTELGRGPAHFQGKDAFRAICQRLPDGCRLNLELSETDEMSFDNH
jgi:hypothetical protein